MNTQLLVPKEQLASFCQKHGITWLGRLWFSLARRLWAGERRRCASRFRTGTHSRFNNPGRHPVGVVRPISRTQRRLANTRRSQSILPTGSAGLRGSPICSRMTKSALGTCSTLPGRRFRSHAAEPAKTWIRTANWCCRWSKTLK